MTDFYFILIRATRLVHDDFVLAMHGVTKSPMKLVSSFLYKYRMPDAYMYVGYVSIYFKVACINPYMWANYCLECLALVFMS